MDADTLACVVTKMNDKLMLCQWTLLRARRSVSKTKVALRKYSLFILKLYPVFTSPRCTDALSLLARVSKLKKTESSVTEKKHTGVFLQFVFSLCALSKLSWDRPSCSCSFCSVNVPRSHCGIQWLKKTWSQSCVCAKRNDKVESEQDWSWSLFRHMLHVCRSVFTFLYASVETVLSERCLSSTLKQAPHVQRLQSVLHSHVIFPLSVHISPVSASQMRQEAKRKWVTLYIREHIFTINKIVSAWFCIGDCNIITGILRVGHYTTCY